MRKIPFRVFSSLPVERLRDAFTALHGNPYYFRKLVEVMLAQPALELDQALKLLHDRIAEEQGFPRLWESLQPIDRAVLMWLARGPAPLFTKAAKAFIGGNIDAPDIAIHTIQASLRRLKTQHLVRAHATRGQYALEDPELGRWCSGILN